MLNKRIHDLRVAQGYSQVALAKRLGVSKQAVSNWENDNIQPSIEMLIRLAELFSVSTDYLLGREAALQVDLSGLDEKVVGHLLAEINTPVRSIKISPQAKSLRGCVIHTLCSDTLPLHADGAGGFGG